MKVFKVSSPTKPSVNILQGVKDKKGKFCFVLFYLRNTQFPVKPLFLTICHCGGLSENGPHGVIYFNT